MQWGPWSINEKHLTLVHEEGYEVSLRECTSSAAILDWIYQIHGKTWADPATLVGLLNAVEDVLHPQENYCGGSVDHAADGGALAQRYIADPGARERMYKSFKGVIDDE
jgi:hypothetical protein